ncbi:sigma factor G inhibitor Gin [Paenibacillus taiwanensis]|uniref:sigma factor G inhibitor Gin n=1 Tax=Paenibacillus taiwanensis TaxID=401638 RepID=UPI0003FD8F28|nr:sigma factor G inhibitor Gin [Paenibacillus taiwanensis]
MEGRTEHCCIVCGQQKTEGMVIVNQFICSGCEQEMVHTDVKDDKYPFYVHQLKRLWLQLQA